MAAKRQAKAKQSSSMHLWQLQRLRQHFHEIAHRHGSHAIWLPEIGFLVTDGRAEPAREFPFETWRMQARRKTGNGTLTQPPAA
jgi:hypothetical protein